MKRFALVLLLALVPASVGSSDLEPLTDRELIEAIDETTLLGRIARGTHRWKT